MEDWIIVLVLLVIGSIFFILYYFLDYRVRKKNFRKSQEVWKNLVKENNSFGFKKRIILIDFFPRSVLYEDISFSDNRLDKWLEGIWVNYEAKIVKFKKDEIYILIPFEDLYDVRMDSIGVSKTKGLGIGDKITFFGASTTEHLKSISIQFVIKDPNGGVKTVELVLCKKFISIKKGTPEANAYEECATAILNEISYIIDNY